jgi:hypothetical protein
MTTVNLERGKGIGTYKMSTGNASLANGDTITVKFSNIESIQLTAVEGTSGDYAFAFVQSVSGSTITVGVYGAASGAAPAALTTAITVHYSVVGY